MGPPPPPPWLHRCTNWSKPSTPPNFGLNHSKTIMMSSKRSEGENYPSDQSHLLGSLVSFNLVRLFHELRSRAAAACCFIATRRWIIKSYVLLFQCPKFVQKVSKSSRKAPRWQRPWMVKTKKQLGSITFKTVNFKIIGPGCSSRACWADARVEESSQERNERFVNKHYQEGWLNYF